VVVGHSTIFSYLTGTKWEMINKEVNYDSDPIEYYSFNNCEFHAYDKYLD
jgi:hypothetical protein